MTEHLPVGGSTGLSHAHSPIVEEAARWFADENPVPANPVVALRQRFELTALEACEALALARNYRLVRGAFG